MPVISYFNLNKIYILNSAFFLTIIFVGIIWMHVLLHAKIALKTNTVCSDPIAKFFNKKAAEKCVLDKMRKDTAWIESKYDKNMILMNDLADERNVKNVDLLEKYKKRNEAVGMNVAASLYKKNKEVQELTIAASNIKNMYSENETGIMSLYDDYSTALANSVNLITELADKISLKLTGGIYVKKKSYIKTRKSLSKSYDKLANQMKKLTTIGATDVGNLSPLTYLQRNGKR